MPDTQAARKSGRLPMHANHNDVASNAKQVSIALLNARLADGIDLALAVKQAHWNLKGPQFIGVHLMLDGFRDQLDDLNDKMAERITALGGTATGTTQAVAKATTLAPYPIDIYAVKDHLVALLDRWGHVASGVRAAIDETDNVDDVGTSDLFTEASRALDKMMWFIEAHVQEPPSFGGKDG
jgi:starvation-inducible DNA-binding protein